jgi:TfoX/Sxy family transcriptional regulator of competence genes
MADLEALRSLVEAAAEGLTAVRRRRIFGCDALFTDGEIFALVWREGRIGLKLTDEKLFDELIHQTGATAWKPGGTAMASWVVVPVKLHEDKKLLRKWVQRAHAQASGAGKGTTARGKIGRTTRSGR